MKHSFFSRDVPAIYHVNVRIGKKSLGILIKDIFLEFKLNENSTLCPILLLTLVICCSFVTSHRKFNVAASITNTELMFLRAVLCPGCNRPHLRLQQLD